MNADEFKKADEIVRALRDYASDCDDDEACCQCTFAWVCDKFDNNAPKIIADLIDSLTAQLAESQRREKAAVEGLEYLMANQYDNAWICDHCVKRPAIGETCKECNPEWRGPQEAEKGENNA